MVPLDAVLIVAAIVVAVLQREVLQVGCGTLVALVPITAVLIVLISGRGGSTAVGSGTYDTMSRSV